ncbi:hypothetical protein [Neorhodopirellula lusitana]|uniref:hypothetical protein n=1 Tax=Neorhodopirellula lusitana TaxID=445327 RepID=UPI00384D9A8E
MPSTVSLQCLLPASTRRVTTIATTMSLALLSVNVGCQRNRFFSPMASRSQMDGSPPSMHGPAISGMGNVANQGQVRVTSEDATPETEIAPVQQRLATAKRPVAPNDTINVSTPLSTETQARPAIHRQPADESNQQPEIQQTAATESVTTANLASKLNIPEQYNGVDVTELISALGDAPPEVQKAAIGRLIAMSRKKAKPTAQPKDIESALAASFDSLPTLPDEVIDRGVSPTRLAASSQPAHSNVQSIPAVDTNPMMAVANASGTSALLSDIVKSTQPEAVTSPESKTATPPQSPAKNAATVVHFNDQSDSIQTVSAESAKNPDSNVNLDQVSQAGMQLPPSEPSQPAPQAEIAPIPNSVASDTPAVTPINPASEFTDAQLFDALVARLQKPAAGESDANRHRRLVMARHLMVLSGDPERAVEKLEGLSREEQEFLRHQLRGLWTIIDPNGHPVPSRRLSSALPEMRKATGYLAAASDSLEVRGLEFCTEIEAYGEVKPFPNRRFVAGQEVILYCEVENFVSADADGGFETRLQGSYDLLDSNGRRVSSQSLPEDQQVSRNRLRDYFVAYQMYLPDGIEPGRYQLRLTMEDLHGKKYGQSTIDFEIKR